MKTTMYCSKYALTSGIMELPGELTDGDYFKPDGWICTYLRVGKDVHGNFNDAVTEAEKQRIKKIASTEKQLKKLRELKFTR